MPRYNGYINYSGVMKMLREFSEEVDASAIRIKAEEVTYLGHANGKFLTAKER